MPHDGQLSHGRDPAQVRAEIARAREEMAESLGELKRELTLRTDWREWVKRRPGLFIAGAFAVGLWLGARR